MNENIEDKTILLGIYFGGLSKRPELMNKPCALKIDKENSQIILSVTNGDSVENISFANSIIKDITQRVRTILSETDYQDKTPNAADVQLLSAALMGSYGGLMGNLINSSGILNNSNSGSVNYTSINELCIEYTNAQGESRRLIVQTDNDPTAFIEEYKK